MTIPGTPRRGPEEFLWATCVALAAALLRAIGSAAIGCPVGIAGELRDIPRAVTVLGRNWFYFATSAAGSGYWVFTARTEEALWEYGDIENGGIRCPYHGWLFDVSGQCLEQPAEPEGSNFCRKVKHLSYVVADIGGLIFAYMGPDQQSPPPLPQYKALVDSNGQRSFEATRQYDYNWLNFIENGADPAHFSILHRADPNDGTWRSWFFNFADVPPFDAVETSYGMKVVSRKPGPTAETEYVDEKSFALPSILQIGDTEFTHFKKPKQALAAGSHNAHFMFVTPNDDDHFTLFTVNHYTGPDPEFFHKLEPSRRITPKSQKKEYDQRRYAPFRGSVRSEDIMSQSTQGSIGERKEQLATSDKGVILLRKIILEAIETALKGGVPKGVPPREQPSNLIHIDSFTGIRPKGVF